MAAAARLRSDIKIYKYTKYEIGLKAVLVL